MRDVRVALAQIAPALGDRDRNLDLHLDTVEQAAAERAEVVVFPELSLTGYVLWDQVPEIACAADDAWLEPLARASRKVDIVAGFVEESPGHRFYNSAAFFSAGRLRFVHRKIYLPTYGMFQEGRDFAAGDRLRRFDAPWGPCGLLVCEDLWHPTSAWLLAQQGAETLLVLSNGPTRGAKPGQGITSIGVWKSLLQVSAQFQTTYMVYVNRTGCEDGLTFGGGSMVVDPFGRVAGELPPLAPGLLVVELRDEVLRRARTAYPLLRDENVELVDRELSRLRRLRYDLPEADDEKSGDSARTPDERTLP